MPSRDRTISVCVPSRNEAETIAGVLEPMARMLEAGAIDQLVVVDDSEDATPEIAARLGAEVHRQSDLGPDGEVLGKGDGLWRSLSVTHGDVLVWLDADCTTVTERYVEALCAPLLRGEADMVKAFYDRPLGDDPTGGGRVNNLLARPLLRRFFPELGWLRSPLAGETAITRELAQALPFVCGYGVEAGLIIDAHRDGARLAQCDLGVYDHRHRPLHELSVMAEDVLDVIVSRYERRRTRLTERPPRTPAARRDRSLG